MNKKVLIPLLFVGVLVVAIIIAVVVRKDNSTTSNTNTNSAANSSNSNRTANTQQQNSRSNTNLTSNANTNQAVNSSVVNSSQALNSNQVVNQSTAATSTTVLANGSTFSPATVTIRTGGTVTWTNNGTPAVYVAPDDHPSHLRYRGIWDDNGTGSIAAGESYSQTFSIPGTYYYHDHLNSATVGTVVVQ